MSLMAGTAAIAAPPQNQRKRAVLQLLFGLLQITGATAGVCLLMTAGVTRQTVVVVATTLMISISSRIIFRRRAE